MLAMSRRFVVEHAFPPSPSRLQSQVLHAVVWTYIQLTQDQPYTGSGSVGRLPLPRFQLQVGQGSFLRFIMLLLVFCVLMHFCISLRDHGLTISCDQSPSALRNYLQQACKRTYWSSPQSEALGSGEGPHAHSAGRVKETFLLSDAENTIYVITLVRQSLQLAVQQQSDPTVLCAGHSCKLASSDDLLLSN